MTNLYSMVTFQNIDTEPFNIEYNLSDPNNAYSAVIQPGQVKSLPFFIAKLAIKHLIDAVLTKQKVPINNQHRREELYSKIVIDVDDIQSPVIKSPERQAIDSIDKYNKLSDLDNILARRAKTPIVPQDDKPTEEKIVTHEEDRTVLKEDKDEPEVFVGLKNATPLPPTRQQLYDYAHNKLGMELDDKTMTKFEAMGVPELIKELDFEVK